MSAESAKKFVGQFEKYLAVKPSGDRHITEDAARGLVGLLEGLSAKHPDLASKSGASPYIFDQKSLKFLVAALDRETDGGKAPSNNLAVAYNMVKYIAASELPDGTPFVSPSVAAPWTAQKQKAQFFNLEVYNELGLDLTPHDNRKFGGGQNYVSHKALFETSNKDSAQQKMINEVARDLKIQGVKLHISEEGRKIERLDPKDPRYAGAMTYYHIDTVSQMATEILSRQARAVCNIGEKDVTRAIMSGQYMPDLMDMRLAEHGFGKPANWDPSRLAESRRIGTVPQGEGNPPPEYDIYRAGQITIHQSQEWAKRFGKIDPSFIKEMTREKGGEWVYDTHQSPHSYYGLIFNQGARAKIYEESRINTYLPRLNWRLHNGLDLCKIDASSGTSPGPDGTTGTGPSGRTGTPVPQRPAADGGTGFVNPNAPGNQNGAGTQNGAAGCSTSSFVCSTTSGGTAPAQSGAATCANSAFVCSDKDKISQNTQDATGRAPATGGECGDIFVCKKPAAAAPAAK
jgi:hypothetical protein